MVKNFLFTFVIWILICLDKAINSNYFCFFISQKDLDFHLNIECLWDNKTCKLSVFWTVLIFCVIEPKFVSVRQFPEK